ncbi:hypothetical protein EF901_17085, partial [Staphylococcus aureus]
TDWFSIVGDGYVALLQMIVMPLIFISIVSAFSKIQIGDKFAKIGTYIFMFLIWYCSYSRYSRNFFMPLSLDLMPQATDWFSIVGDGYVALLQMIVMPLIFISIVSAFS